MARFFRRAAIVRAVICGLAIGTMPTLSGAQGLRAPLTMQIEDQPGYEPDASAILDGLLMRYIESQVYRGAVENVASEMAARMVAMKAATDNAGKLISELQLVYNKARQAAITKELAEIVGGAAAV